MSATIEERRPYRPAQPELIARDLSHQPQNRIIRWLATLVSYLFHPLFIPVYLVWMVTIAQPQLFAGFTSGGKWLIIIRFFIHYTFFPLVTVLLARGLGFVQSIHLGTQRERVIPYIACGIYFFWMAYVLRHQPANPPQIVQLTMAFFVASSLGLIANIFMKVSMHAISVGIMLVFLALLSATFPGLTLYLSLAVLLTGLVCTSRLIVSDHTGREIYWGLLTGLASMLIAIWADGILP